MPLIKGIKAHFIRTICFIDMPWCFLWGAIISIALLTDNQDDSKFAALPLALMELLLGFDH